MADESDQIRVDLASDTSEGERARKKLAEIQKEVKELQSAFEGNGLSTDRFNQRLKELTSEAGRAQKALDRLGDTQGKSGKLTGAARTNAKFQAGLFAANTAQDVIQGGAASGVNNVLGIAQNKAVLRLGGEALAAVGGIGALTGALATVGVVAGASFLVINEGLKSAKLEWSDLDDIASNTTAWKALEGSIQTVGDTLRDLGVTQYLNEVVDNIYTGVHAVADFTIGWDEATEATRKQKEETERATKAAREYAEAAKSIAGVKSDASETREKTGKNVAREIANLGGEGDIGAVADKLADQATARTAKDENGKDRMVKVKELKKGQGGNPDTFEDVEITRREKARREYVAELARAQGGDQGAIDRLRPQLKKAGYDTADMDAAASGRDLKKEKKDAEAKEKREKKEAADDAERESARRAEELAKPLQERFNVMAGKGDTPDRARVIKALVGSGVGEAEAHGQSDAVLKKLRGGFDDEMYKRRAGGMSEAGARADIVKDAEDKHAKEEQQKADQADAAKDKAKREAVEKAEKVSAGTNLGGRVDDALLRSALKSGAAPGVATKEVTDQIARELQAKGLGADEASLAAGEIAKKHAGKLGDEVNEAAFSPSKAKEMAAPQHIAGADFARSVESAGAEDSAKLLSTTEAMKDKLTELVRLQSMGARLQ